MVRVNWMFAYMKMGEQGQKFRDSRALSRSGAILPDLWQARVRKDWRRSERSWRRGERGRHRWSD